MAELLARHLDISHKELEDFIKFARMETGKHEFSLTNQDGQRKFLNLFSHKPANLPSQITSLIGRGQAVRSIQQRLIDENIRLLTLIGPPGVGKTRLAIEVAYRLVDEFEDGVHFVPLAPVIDPGFVPAAIAHTLGVNQIGEQSFTYHIKKYISDKHMLLLLDNLEQVVTAAPIIADLLSACPWLSIMTTSRTPLSIRGEHLFPVSPMTLPDKETLMADPMDFLGYSALELFVERAHAVRSDLELDPENIKTILAICEHLDGLPLAIELVSSRTRFLSLNILKKEISSEQILHTSGLRDTSDRHRTLHSAIDWSYNLLTRDQQQLLASLSVFDGGWTMDAVEGIMKNKGLIPIVESMNALVENSLILQQTHHNTVRFSMLETIHEFASEQLIKTGEENETRQRHAEYYLTFAEEADSHLRNGTQLTWLEQLEVNRGNFRSALTWFIENSRIIEKGMQLAGALGWFWNLRGYLSEGREWLERVLVLGKDIHPAARMKVLISAGLLAWAQGDLTHAINLLEQSVILGRALGNTHTWDLAWALGSYGNVVMYQNDHQALLRVAEESLALFTQLEDIWGIGLTTLLIGEVHLLKHDYVLACESFGEASSLLWKTGDKWALGVALMDLGYAESLVGDLLSARAHLEESIELHKVIGERIIRSITLNILAQVVQQQDDAKLAVALYAESLDLIRKMGIETRIADVQFNLASFIHAHGHDQLAKRLYNECLDMFSKQGNDEGISKCQAGLAAINSLDDSSSIRLP